MAIQKNQKIKNYKFFIACLLFSGMLMFLPPATLHAQNQDTTASDTLLRYHSPSKAVIYSLICPGLGQVYNKKYWKIPFIYAAGGTFLYFIRYNQLTYKEFMKAIDSGEDFAYIHGYRVRKDRFEASRDYFRRYRDLSIAGFGAIYLINVIDALVDAHFFYYDISDDLSMRVEPAIINSPGMTATLGLQINLGF